MGSKMAWPAVDPKTKEQFLPNESPLRFQPRTAGGDFARVWFLMNASFATRFPFEMLHRVRDVNLLAIDSGFFERAIHNFSRRSDKRFAGHILVIAGLLPDQHNRCALPAFAKNGLRSPFVKMTSRAISRGVADLR
jgi:hypothetical protein